MSAWGRNPRSLPAPTNLWQEVQQDRGVIAGLKAQETPEMLDFW